ncbi:apolipophorins-like, partial [Ctenocephalides felis]|uniref:apolipophorins-like n=1 Tax=Ctenocephalides felis TaxID=7515 RepID=UPI000E6E4233
MNRTMANTRPPQLFLFCFLLIQAGFQSTQAAKCSTGCTSSSSLFSYQVGHTYEYALDSTLSVLLSGGDTQENIPQNPWYRSAEPVAELRPTSAIAECRHSVAGQQ